MNHKRITNQILNQKNFTLNSTLNYLFNISNMKKLFSYLLISSMVVLSSCTNYDDQFDDLNTQINSLKSQIEGFSSLSSGLSALQGTVAALQTAVANIPVTPATDVSGLESGLADLQDLVESLKTQLDNAATAESVSELAAALEAAQADLQELLDSNNIYAPTGGAGTELVVESQSQLDFALALGDKVSIVNGDVKITHTKTMSDSDVAALMAKMTTVTGDVTYSATETTTVPGVFSELVGSADITITQTGDISLPKYVESTGTLKLTGNEFTTSVDLSALTAAASLSFNSLGDVETFDMSSLAVYDGDITIEIDNAGTVDLSALTNSTKEDGTADKNTTDVLTVNAAVLKAPLYDAGKIVADRLINVDLPLWPMASGSSFDRAQTVVLPSVKPTYTSATVTTGYEIVIDDVFDSATSVHFIAAAAVKATSPVHMSVSSTSSKLETLILGGTYATVDISGTDVTSLTFDGTAQKVTVDSTDIETLDMPYTSAAKGEFVVTNNSKLTSLSADKIDGLAKFTLTGNSDLTDISFDALKVSAATGALITVSGNDLSVEKYSEAQTAPVVAKSIVSADLAVLKAFTTDAISKVSAANAAKSIIDIDVDADDIVRYYKADGEEGDVPSTAGSIVNYSYVAVADNSVPADAKVEEMYISALTTGQSAVFKVDDESVSLIPGTALDDFYDVKNWAEDSATVAALDAVGLEITAYGKARPTAEIEFTDITGTSISNVANVVFSLDAGTGDTVSVVMGAASTTEELTEALKNAIDLEDGVVSKYYTVATGTNKLTFESTAYGSHREVFSISSNAYQLSSTVEGTPISFGSASVSIDNLIEGVGAAFVQFTSKAAGTTGAKTITLVGYSTATLLTASGVDTDLDGDNETFTAATDLVENTADNSDAVKAASVNNMQYVSAS